MSDNVLIKKVDKTNICDIVRLENSYPYEMYSNKQLMDMFDLNYYVFFKAEINGVVVGYLCATIIFDECNILKIIVDEKFKRMGIGSKLLDYLKNICKESSVSQIYLEVRDNNNSAIKFYEKNKYTLAGIRKGYYDGLDARIYSLQVV